MEKLAEALRKAIDDKNHSLRAAAREMNVATGTAVLAGVMAGEFEDLAVVVDYLWELGPG